MGIQSSKEGPRLQYLMSLRDRQACLQAIQHGTDLNLLDHSGRSPLRAALDEGDADIFLALVTARAEMHPPLTMGLTPLHVAVTLGHYSLAKMILRDHRTFPGLRNSRDVTGRTPLHVAVQADNPEMVALLLKYNCNPLLKDQSGLTPKDLALFSRSPLALEIIDQLSIEDVMQKQATKSISGQTGGRPLYRNSQLTLDPVSRGASSHGSKSTLKSQTSEPQPPTTELEPVSLDALLNLEEEIKQNCIPIIHGSEILFEEIINRGSSCEVFKGHWRGCEVAIKKFKEEYKQNPKELSKFVKEMQTLAHVRHPNLILLMGICIDLSNLCLITEYVPNMSLFYALHSTFHPENKAKKLSLTERFSIAVQICKGLAYLHAASPPIVHRDLKPENCLLDYSLNVKIADFGLARPLTCFTTEEAMTTTCIGTTRFMAPELFEKEKVSDIGVEVDIWALGCILVELFSNKRPWDYISSTNANCIYYEVSARQIFKKKPLPVPDSIPVEVRGIIQHCCQYPPKRRPSASEVLDQLQIISQRYYE